MKSFFEEEQERIKKEKYLAKMKRILGRDYNLPKNVSGKNISYYGNSPLKVLTNAGYKYNNGKGYILQINKKSRYHIYIDHEKERFIMHKDTTSQAGKHRAVFSNLNTERDRIKSFIIKVYRPTVKKVTEKMLSKQELQVALNKIKQFKKKWWQFWK